MYAIRSYYERRVAVRGNEAGAVPDGDHRDGQLAVRNLLVEPDDDGIGATDDLQLVDLAVGHSRRGCLRRQGVGPLTGVEDLV